MANKILVNGWQPISEYNVKLRPFVVLKVYDKENNKYYTDFGWLLADGKWCNHDRYLPFKPEYFFDIDQVPFIY